MLAPSKKSLPATSLVLLFLVLNGSGYAQSGRSSSVTGTVVDPSGAVVPNATVTIRNSVSAFERTTTTDESGNFAIPNVPFNPYHLTVTSTGFDPYAQDI